MPKKDTQFKKGSSGNPQGRPKLPEDVRKARDLTSQEFIKIASEFLAMDRQAIQVRLQDPQTSMLELIVGGIVAKSAKDHDHLRANFLLDRTIGKVKEQVELNISGQLATMSDAELMAAGRVAVQILDREKQIGTATDE